MRMKFGIMCLAVFSLCSSDWATAAMAPVQILGLPLGGHVNLPIRACKQSEIGAIDVKSICWVSHHSSIESR
jgi:hypothetical protein